jgi:hypothetical protein
MTLTASIAKTTSAWVVGTAAGGKSQTGAVANNTWYHFYEILRPDTGVVDVCFSTNATGLVAADFVAGGGNVANAYTKFRRIGSGRTNGSAQWTSFIQTGDIFEWVAPPTDSTTVPTTPTLRTLTTPLGIITLARMGIQVGSAGGVSTGASHWNPALGATLPSGNTGIILVTEGAAGTLGAGAELYVLTNTSSQIYNSVIGTVTSYSINTLSWTDTRGRNG